MIEARERSEQATCWENRRRSEERLTYGGQAQRARLMEVRLARERETPEATSNTRVKGNDYLIPKWRAVDLVWLFASSCHARVM